MSRAIGFLFPHRKEELSKYAEYIEGLFSAKHTSTHSKVILYDQSVRNQVGGGQNILLTDYQRFSHLAKPSCTPMELSTRGVEEVSRKEEKGQMKEDR
jgi:hypothetical protein